MEKTSGKNTHVTDVFGQAVSSLIPAQYQYVTESDTSPKAPPDVSNKSPKLPQLKLQYKYLNTYFANLVHSGQLQFTVTINQLMLYGMFMINHYVKYHQNLGSRTYTMILDCLIIFDPKVN